MTALAARLRSRPKPAPVLINGKLIRARALQQKIHFTLYAFILAMVAAGFYFGLLEVNWYVHIGPVYFHLFYLKKWWDVTASAWFASHLWFINAKNVSVYRHSVPRNLAEPAAAGVGVMVLAAPAKYQRDKLGWQQYAIRLPLFVIAYLILACLGTWLILFGQPRFQPTGFGEGAWAAAQAIILGGVISWLLHQIFGPIGARIQGIWIKLAAAQHFLHRRRGLPWWIRWPVLAPSIRERGQERINEMRKTGENIRLIQMGTTDKVRRDVLFWLAMLVILIFLGIAFLGFIGHFWVGVLGHTFPYLAPGH